MNKTIAGITITYTDGSTDKLPESLIDKMVKYQGDHKSIVGFLTELIRELDIKYALNKLGLTHSKELQKLTKEHYDDLEKQSLMLEERSNQLLIKQGQELEHKYQVNLNKQRGSVSGYFVEKFLPYFPEYNYNQFDVINIGSPFDMLVLNGLEDNKRIDSLIFQEVKTGHNARSIPACNSKERAVVKYCQLKQTASKRPAVKYCSGAIRSTTGTTLCLRPSRPRSLREHLNNNAEYFTETAISVSNLIHSLVKVLQNNSIISKKEDYRNSSVA